MKNGIVKKKITEIIGPGGRMMVPEEEAASFLARPGWALANGTSLKEQVVSRGKEAGPVVPSSERIIKMRATQLQRIIKELELDIIFPRGAKISEKRVIVNTALQEYR